jgi:hypothetical protein
VRVQEFEMVFLTGRLTRDVSGDDKWKFLALSKLLYEE